MNVNSQVGLSIKYWRRERGLTQEQVAGRLDPVRTGAAVSELERGQVHITIDLIQQLAMIFKVTPLQLIRPGGRCPCCGQEWPELLSN